MQDPPCSMSLNLGPCIFGAAFDCPLWLGRSPRTGPGSVVSDLGPLQARGITESGSGSSLASSPHFHEPAGQRPGSGALPMHSWTSGERLYPPLHNLEIFVLWLCCKEATFLLKPELTEQRGKYRESRTVREPGGARNGGLPRLLRTLLYSAE